MWPLNQLSPLAFKLFVANNQVAVGSKNPLLAKRNQLRLWNNAKKVVFSAPLILAKLEKMNLLENKICSHQIGSITDTSIGKQINKLALCKNTVVYCTLSCVRKGRTLKLFSYSRRKSRIDEYHAFREILENRIIIINNSIHFQSPVIEDTIIPKNGRVHIGILDKDHVSRVCN